MFFVLDVKKELIGLEVYWEYVKVELVVLIWMNGLFSLVN